MTNDCWQSLFNSFSQIDISQKNTDYQKDFILDFIYKNSVATKLEQ